MERPTTSRTTRKSVKNSSSKTGSRRQSRKTTISKRFLRVSKWKSPAPKMTKSAEKSLSQPWCSHSTTISLSFREVYFFKGKVRSQFFWLAASFWLLLAGSHFWKSKFLTSRSHFFWLLGLLTKELFLVVYIYIYIYMYISIYMYIYIYIYLFIYVYK